MSAPPYMKLYVADYLGDTHHLGVIEHGAYLLLLMAMWRAGGSLPAADANLAKLARCTPDQWAEIRDTLLPYFKRSRSRLTHKRLGEELAKYENTSGKRSEAGKRGASQKAIKNNGHPLAIADQTNKQLPTYPEPEPEEDRPPNPPQGGERADRFAEGWNAYPIAGRGNAGPAKASAEWAAAVERAGGEDALIGAIRAHAARLASDGSKAKNFDRWLRDDGFAAYLGQTVAAPVTTWSGPAEVWREASLAMGEETVRTYLGRCAWQDSPVRAVIAPHEFAAGKLRSGAGAVLASLGVQILVGETPAPAEGRAA